MALLDNKWVARGGALSFLVGAPSFVIGRVGECGLLTVLGFALMAIGVALLAAMWRARGKRPSDQELTQRWQEACDDLTEQLHRHGCYYPWMRGPDDPPPSDETAREMRDEYQRNHRRVFLALHDQTRPRLPFLADNRFRPRLYAPGPDEMWELMRDIGRQVIRGLDPSRTPRKQD